MVSVPRSEEVRFKDMCTARQFPFARIGVVDALSNALDFQNEVSINLVSCVPLTKAPWQLTLVRWRKARSPYRHS